MIITSELIKKLIKNANDEILLCVPENLKEITNDEFLMVEITKENSIIIEKVLRNDPNYKRNAEAIFDDVKRKNSFTKENYLRIITQIAHDNSTRTDNVSLELLSQYIVDSKYNFIKDLKDGKIRLVDDMVDFLKQNKQKAAKSLCSKICKYLNQWMFNGKDFTINDSIVRTVLPYYCAKYDININLWNKDLEKIKYVDYYIVCKTLCDAINAKAKSKINLHELDHILWYSYKSDPIRMGIARQVGEKVIEMSKYIKPTKPHKSVKQHRPESADSARAKIEGFIKEQIKNNNKIINAGWIKTPEAMDLGNNQMPEICTAMWNVWIDKKGTILKMPKVNNHKGNNLKEKEYEYRMSCEGKDNKDLNNTPPVLWDNNGHKKDSNKKSNWVCGSRLTIEFK